MAASTRHLGGLGELFRLPNHSGLLAGRRVCWVFNPPNQYSPAENRRLALSWWQNRKDRGITASSGKASGPSGDAFRNTAPGLKGRALPGPDDYEQISALAERGRARTARFFKMLDRHLAGRQFVASDRYTIADIMALVTVNFVARVNLAIPEGRSHLRRWHETVSARPSAAA